jgi:hypothetical protein
MFDRRRQKSVGSFLLGGLLGGVAGVLAAGRLRRAADGGPGSGSRDALGPFEEAPCHREWQHAEVSREAQESPPD